MSEPQLQLGPNDFTLPLNAMQLRVAIVGTSGSGKTVAAKDFAEEILESGFMQVGVFDLTDVWWGMRSSADGASTGYPIVVFGGRHGDAPLTAESGAIIAHAFLAERAWTLLREE